MIKIIVWLKFYANKREIKYNLTWIVPFLVDRYYMPIFSKQKMALAIWLNEL